MTTLRGFSYYKQYIIYILIFYFASCFPFQVILGKVVRFPTTLDEQLQKQLLECSGEILTATGNTMCTHDFYEGKMMFYNNCLITLNLFLQDCAQVSFS